MAGRARRARYRYRRSDHDPAGVEDRDRVGYLVDQGFSMLDQNDQKVESATAKTNRLLAFLEKSLCRKQAERAERDRSLVRDEGSDHKSNFFLLNSSRQVQGAVTPPIYPADLLPTRNEPWRR